MFQVISATSRLGPKFLRVLFETDQTVVNAICKSGSKTSEEFFILGSKVMAEIFVAWDLDDVHTLSASVQVDIPSFVDGGTRNLIEGAARRSNHQLAMGSATRVDYMRVMIRVNDEITALQPKLVRAYNSPKYQPSAKEKKKLNLAERYLVKGDTRKTKQREQEVVRHRTEISEKMTGLYRIRRELNHIISMMN